MLQPDDVPAALALKPLRDNLALRSAIEAHLARRRGDLFAAWAHASTPEAAAKFTKDYCRGSLDVIDGILADFDQIIDLGESSRQAEEEDDEDVVTFGRGGDPAL